MYLIRNYTLVVVVVYFFSQTSPALLPHENLIYLLDSLSNKLKSFKYNNSTAALETRLSETDKQIMQILLKNLRTEVMNDDEHDTVSIADNTKITRRYPGYNMKCRCTNSKNVGKSVDFAVKHYTVNVKENILAKNVATTTTTITDLVGSSTAEERGDYPNDGVDHIGSKPVQLFDKTKDPKPSKFDRYNNPKIQKMNRKMSPDPLLMRFKRISDMLDRPDGVDEALKSAIASTATMAPSIALDHVKCPFDTLVDDKALTESVLTRLKNFHESKSYLQYY